jgi:hypothetical protein
MSLNFFRFSDMGKSSAHEEKKRKDNDRFLGLFERNEEL